MTGYESHDFSQSEIEAEIRRLELVSAATRTRTIADVVSVFAAVTGAFVFLTGVIFAAINDSDSRLLGVITAASALVYTTVVLALFQGIAMVARYVHYRALRHAAEDDGLD